MRQLKYSFGTNIRSLDNCFIELIFADNIHVMFYPRATYRKFKWQVTVSVIIQISFNFD